MLDPDDHVLKSGCSEDLKSEILIFDAGVTIQVNGINYFSITLAFTIMLSVSEIVLT
jgi:hypothetical protein